MDFGSEHSAHCLQFGQAPRGRRSGVPGWPSAPPRGPGGVATEDARRSERLIGNRRARAPRPGNVGVAGRTSDRPDDWRIPPWHHREGRKSSQVEVDPLVEGYGVAVATGLPVAGHARLHQQPLALVVIIGRDLSRQRGTRAYDAHPFYQDENTRLPAEMLRLDSRTICFLEFESPDFCNSFQPSSAMEQLRKTAFESDSKSSH